MMRALLVLMGLTSMLLSSGVHAAPAASKSTPATQKAKASKPAAPAASAPAAPVTPPPAAPPPAPAHPVPAPAPVPAEPAAQDATALPGRLQRPGDIDLRVMFNADIILAFVNVGVGADVGVARLGPGTLSVGGEFEAGVCFTACLLLNAVTGWSFSHAFYSPHARIAYHLLPPKARGLEKVDLYGVLLAGATFTTTRVTGGASGAAFDYQGRDVAPSGGIGAGAKFFVRDNLFFGAEARFRLSSGVYTYTANVGNVSISDTESTWSMSGLSVQLFGGLRL